MRFERVFSKLKRKRWSISLNAAFIGAIVNLLIYILS